MSDTHPNFWEHNRIDPSWPLTEEELRTKFTLWMTHNMADSTEGAKLSYYSSDIIIRIFLSDPGEYGVGAIYNDEQYKTIRQILSPVLVEQLKTSPPTEVSTLVIEDRHIEIVHIGAKSLTRDAWKKIINGLAEDLEKGSGSYPLEDLQAVVKWKTL